MTLIAASSVLPARRYPVSLLTEDGVRLVGEWSLPEQSDPSAVIVFCHPLPTHGGSMDSHIIRKAAWRLPALAGIGVLRFNTRGTSAGTGTSEGEFDENRGEGQDLLAAVAEVTAQGFVEALRGDLGHGREQVLALAAVLVELALAGTGRGGRPTGVEAQDTDPRQSG